VRLGFVSEVGIEALKLESPQAGGFWIPDVGNPPKADQVATDTQALNSAGSAGQLLEHGANGPPATLVAGLSLDDRAAIEQSQLLNLESGGNAFSKSLGHARRHATKVHRDRKVLALSPPPPIAAPWADPQPRTPSCRIKGSLEYCSDKRVCPAHVCSGDW
jgi:hypothetical protein